MKKSDSKEAYRLWYEFLRRAITYKRDTVNMGRYAAWQDVADKAFDTWWRETGLALLARGRVALVANADLPDKNCVLVSVPLSLTPTDAAHHLRKLLLEHYKVIRHTPTAEHGIALTEGKEIKVQSFRAYLRTYDAYQQLATAGDGAVTMTPLLRAVREAYVKKLKRWPKSDRLPTALADTKENYSGALKAIRRYLTNAETIVANVAKGDFPGQY